ncbi:RlpA-like double-psi beta-barrel-protein domain-containing protein-containing protein [Chytridium lagenaria]|nr:RlpA-like double-psi beta-barrel-protein domain-containing protein-containing protein [Chytridium lagenaria]
MIAIKLLLSVTALIAGVSAQLNVGDSFIGSVTYYGDGGETGADPTPHRRRGACGMERTPDEDYFAALWQPMWNAHMTTWPSRVCGQCVSVTCAPGNNLCQGRSVVVPIADSCPGCHESSVDISHVAFGRLVGSYDRATEIGRMAISWTVVDCPGVWPWPPLPEEGGSTPQPQPQPQPQQPQPQQPEPQQPQQPEPSPSSEPSPVPIPEPSAPPSTYPEPIETVPTISLVPTSTAGLAPIFVPNNPPKLDPSTSAPVFVMEEEPAPVFQFVQADGFNVISTAAAEPAAKSGAERNVGILGWMVAVAAWMMV